MPQTGSTLAEMQKHDTESVAPAVIDETITRDPITTRVPYLTLGGTQFRYLRESTDTEPEFFTLDEELIENNPTVTEVTLTLKQIGQNADTEGFATTLESRKSQRGYVLFQVAKGMMEKIGERFVYGNNTSASKEFNGIHALMPSSQTQNEGSSATGDALNLLTLSTAKDTVKNGRVQLFSLASAVKLQISGFVNHASAHPIRTEKNEFGILTDFYDNVPLEINDRQVQTETISGGTFSAKTGGATSSIFALQFGLPQSSNPGIFGLQGPRGMSATPIGYLHNKDKWRDRMIWEVALGLGSTKSVARVDGITNATVTA